MKKNILILLLILISIAISSCSIKQNNVEKVVWTSDPLILEEPATEQPNY